MIDERIRIEYAPISPSGDRRQRQHQVATDVEHGLERRLVPARRESSRTSGTSARPAAKMMISGMPMTKYGIE